MAIAILCSCTVFAQPASEYNALGFEAYEAGNWAEAIESFSRALDSAPENKTIRRNLSNAYQALGREYAKAKNIPAALAQLNQAIGVDPANPQPYIQSGAYYLQEGLVPEAISRLEEALQLTPKDVDTHFLLGEGYYRDGDFMHAIEQWEWVFEVDPGYDGLAARLKNALREWDVEEGFDLSSSRYFNISFDTETERRDVREVLRLLEKAYRRIGLELGGAYPPTPIQVTLYKAEGFSQTTQMGEHVGALFDGNRIKVPVIDKQGNFIEAKELERRLVHEYVHVVVHYIAKDNVPWWLNEGLAETLSRDMTSLELDFLRRAKEKGILFSLTELTESQLDKLDPESLALAYRQAHAAVEFLKKRRGKRGLTSLMGLLEAGEDPETALSYATRYNYKTLDLAVASYIQTGAR
ncbi:MAG: tetratricopeptide repeat protein [Candidatus Hydrogenedentes bacterium]|nr:tetratricopeptide repeat protein [Candidatus Hydrogenedentota bacterium]